MSSNVDMDKMFVNIRLMKSNLAYETILRIQLVLIHLAAKSKKIASAPLPMITTTGGSVMSGDYHLDIRYENRVFLQFKNPNKGYYWDMYGSDLLFEVFNSNEIAQILAGELNAG